MRQPTRFFSLVLLLACLFMRKLALAQEQSSGAVVGIEETQAVNSNPEKLFYEVKTGARVQPKLGNVEGTFNTQFHGPLLNVPLLNQGLRPEDAEIKLGNFYLDLRSVSGSLLYSDNINLSSHDRKDGFIAITRLRLASILQISDNLRLTLAGTLIYLPLKNKFGVAGFGIEDALAGFENTTLAQAQITYDFNLGEWHTETFDDFRVRLGRFGESYELFEGSTFDEEDRAGRYTFRDTTRTRNTRFGDSFLETRNVVGFSTDRLLPTETRLEFGANRSDFWYQGERGGFLPASRDLAYVSLTSERESLRFKPFAGYRVFRYENNPFNQEATVGVQGPITENLEFLGEVGYFSSGRSDRNTYIGRARLGHTINSRTFQELAYVRRVTQPDQDIEQTLSYSLRRNLAQDAYGEVFAIASRFDDFDGNRSSSEELRTGARLSMLVGQDTTLRVSGTYTRIDYDADFYGDRDRWTAQASLRYNTLEGRFIYRYESVSATTTRESYYENLFALTVTKYF